MDFNTLISRIIHTESRGNPNAVSPAGAVGLMQIMPGTAQQPGFGVTPISLDDRLDPVKNRAFGEQYVRAMMNRYNGNLEKTLIAYNAGPGVADKWGGDRSTLPRETQGYLSQILGNKAMPSYPAGGAAQPQQQQMTPAQATGIVQALFSDMPQAQQEEPRGVLDMLGASMAGMGQTIFGPAPPMQIGPPVQYDREQPELAYAELFEALKGKV